MIALLTTIHVTVCVILIVIVLLQQGKGEGLGSGLGGGGSQSVFGARGTATFLSKVTTGAAITFMVTSLSLAYISARDSSKSLLEPEKPKAESSTPIPGNTPVATVTPKP